MGEPRLDRRVPPGEIDLALLARALHVLGELDHPLRRVLAAVEEDVLDVLEQVLRDVLVELELAGVHDAHVHAGLRRVVEEGRVDRLAYAVVAAEREGEVRHAARDVDAGAALPDDARRLDEVLRVVRVLLDARRDREDVRDRR